MNDIFKKIIEVANMSAEKRNAFIFIIALLFSGKLIYDATTQWLTSTKNYEVNMQNIVNSYEAQLAKKDAQLEQCNNERISASIEREKKYFELFLENKQLKQQIESVEYDLKLKEEDANEN